MLYCIVLCIRKYASVVLYCVLESMYLLCCIVLCIRKYVSVVLCCVVLYCIVY